MDTETTQKDPTPQTRWMHRHGLIRPGIHIPEEVWERFGQAVTLESYQRAQDGLPSVSRTSVLTEFMRKWSERKLQDAL